MLNLEHRNPVPPRFNERVSPAPIRTGETIVLSCISQGIPPPTYLWFRESVSGTAMIFNSERIHARAGVLILQAARPEDAGRYVCHANNTAGSERVELEVSIISSISIHLTPQQGANRFRRYGEYLKIRCRELRLRDITGIFKDEQSGSGGSSNSNSSSSKSGIDVTVDLGKDAEFQCSVTGRPLPVISWAKDGLPVREGSSGRTKITENGGSTLHISSIVRDDKGMYQCFAKNDYEMVQATAELRLGEISYFLGEPGERPIILSEISRDSEKRWAACTDIIFGGALKRVEPDDDDNDNDDDDDDDYDNDDYDVEVEVEEEEEEKEGGTPVQASNHRSIVLAAYRGLSCKCCVHNTPPCGDPEPISIPYRPTFGTCPR
ncbi:hypothetical protein HZH68_014336 [Vespula germanica]|uniref:Ig-like domain-containing protein n=1 Tax=Vespula germanica TaxID=30212 RepID=A0A834MV18_VESGE|nr:hypothetical protein HZH68_014336 [Vespula germanica]